MAAGVLPWDDIVLETCRVLRAYSNGKRNDFVSITNLVIHVEMNPDMTNYPILTSLAIGREKALKTRIGIAMAREMKFKRFSRFSYIIDWQEVDRICRSTDLIVASTDITA